MLVACGISVVLGGLAAASGTPDAQAAVTSPINGAGSTWSANAIQQWAVNVKQFGTTVNYAATGSADGRQQFANGVVDFAVSDVPYGLTDTGVTDPLPARDFTYLPLVAGGTALPYHLTVAGKPLTGLRLSGAVVAAIFTGTITSWDDRAIAADNPGLALPAEAIVPVVRSDGAGSTREFSAWLAHEHPGAWDTYCARAARPTPCGATSTYPVVAGSTMVAQTGSVGVAAWVAQPSAEGSITYVEYSYALNAGLPVAKLLNASGHYVAPTAPAVVAALQAATATTDHTLDLAGVYANSDPRSYPLSGLSYLIVPTGATDPTLTPGKSATLTEFTRYALCEGQQVAEVLGYAPLPPALVTLAAEQRARITGTTATAGDLAACVDPTVARSAANLLVTAPAPPACDRLAATPCELAPTPSPTPAPSPSPSPSPSALPTNSPSPSQSPSGCVRTDGGGHYGRHRERDDCRSEPAPRCRAVTASGPWLVRPIPRWTRTFRLLG